MVILSRAVCRPDQGGTALSGRDRTEPFSPTVAIAVIMVGLLCFAGFVVLFAFAEGSGARDGRANAASRSAVGFAGLVELLCATGTPATTSRNPRLAEVPGGGLLVLTPPPGTAPPPELPDLIRNHTVLLVLAKWETTPLDDHPGWIRTAGLLRPEAVLTSLPGKAVVTGLTRRNGTNAPLLTSTGIGLAVAPGPIETLQVLERAPLKALLTDRDGGVVLGMTGDGLYVLSDPDLLNNAGLAGEDGARAAAAAIGGLAHGRPVTFDLSLDGFGRSRNPLRAIFEPPLLGMTLCAAASALLAGMLSAVRFGPALAARRSFELGKTALAGNSAALIARAGREARMALPYAELSRTLAARALGLSRRLDSTETTTALERARTPDSPSLGALLRQAGAVRDRPGLLASARAVYRWRQELVRGHR